jgi:hypothetical protein
MVILYGEIIYNVRLKIHRKISKKVKTHKEHGGIDIAQIL